MPFGEDLDTLCRYSEQTCVVGSWRDTVESVRVRNGAEAARRSYEHWAGVAAAARDVLRRASSGDDDAWRAVLAFVRQANGTDARSWERFRSDTASLVFGYTGRPSRQRLRNGLASAD